MLFINDRILRFFRFKLEAQFKKLWKGRNFKKAALIILAGEMKKQEKIPPFQIIRWKMGLKEISTAHRWLELEKIKGIGMKLTS